MRIRNNNVDIFCSVIDNFGDAGFSYRLALALKNKRGETSQIRLLIDDLITLQKILPEIDVLERFQIINGVHIILLNERENKKYCSLTYAPLIIASLGSNIPEYLKKAVLRDSELILNIEHLTAEFAFESMHGLMMPGLSIPRYMICQGFTEQSGGILIEQDISQKIIASSKSRNKLRHERLLPYKDLLPIEDESVLIGSLFSYKHDFSTLIKNLGTLAKPVILFVLGDFSQDAIKETLEGKDFRKMSDNVVVKGTLSIIFESFLSMDEYDQLLMTADFNFVRGEDSFARAILAGKPFIWHSYEQNDNYQLTKVSSFLNIMKRYQNDDNVFQSYSNLLMAYNIRQPYLELSTYDENYCHFLNNFAKIEYWIYNLRQFLIAKGGLIAEIEKFIVKI